MDWAGAGVGEGGETNSRQIERDLIRLYTIGLYNYGYLRIVRFSLSCKALSVSESSLYKFPIIIIIINYYYYYNTSLLPRDKD